MTEAAVKPNIVLLITNLGLGGAQRAFSEQAVYLKQRFAITEVVFDVYEAADMYKTGNTQLSLDITAGKSVFEKLFKLYNRAANLKRVIMRTKAAVCISHMDGANWVNVLSHSRAKKILVVHGTILHDFSTPRNLMHIRKNWVIPYLYKQAACVVAVSEGIKKELESACGLKNVVAIPNAFDRYRIEQDSRLPLTAGWEAVFASAKILITSGRLHEQKKQGYLLPLFKKVRQAVNGVRLIILGDGPLRTELLQEAKTLGLKCYAAWDENAVLSTDYDVYFTGYVTNPFQYLHRSTLFLFPSAWEGFPLALCEAMISGVPVLAADCPTGPREIIAPGSFDMTYRLRGIEETPYGCLLPMTDKPEFEMCWYQTIIELLEDGEKRTALIRKGKERMMDFDQSVILEKWFYVIDRVMASS